MYHAIVARRTRDVWARISAGDAGVPWAMAAQDLTFEFVGTSALGARFTGRDEFRAWLEGVFQRFPGIKFDVHDVAVAGWPWHTRVSVRLRISATLADGSVYENWATQWITLRWGRMTDDWVLEDTATLERALTVQSAQISAGCRSGRRH